MLSEEQQTQKIKVCPVIQIYKYYYESKILEVLTEEEKSTVTEIFVPEIREFA